MPFIVGPLIRGQDFFNRNDITERLLEAVTVFKRKKYPTHHLIIGPRRVGKTSILFFVRDKLIETGNYVPLYVDGEVIISLEDFYTAVFQECLKQSSYARMQWYSKKLLESISQFSFGGISIKFDENSEKIRDKLMQTLVNYSSTGKKPFILLLDEISFLSNLTQREALEIVAFLKKTSSHLMIIGAMASESYSFLSEKYPIISNIFTTSIVVGPFTESETYNFISLLESEEKLRFTEDGKKKIYELSGGFPYYINLIGSECSMVAHKQKFTFVTPEIVEKTFSRMRHYYMIDEIFSLPKELRAVTSAIAEGNVDVDSIIKTTSHVKNIVTSSVEYLKRYGYVREEENGTLTPLHPILESKIFKDAGLKSKYSIENLPGKEITRVFIGGNYDYMATLRELAKFVEELNLYPIIAYDFDVPKDKIHEYDLKLLHRCKNAIFEVTAPNGHHYEIQKGLEYNVKVFLLYQVRDKKRILPPTITTMLSSFNIQGIKPETFGYITFEEARRQIVKWLSK